MSAVRIGKAHPQSRKESEIMNESHVTAEPETDEATEANLAVEAKIANSSASLEKLLFLLPEKSGNPRPLEPSFPLKPPLIIPDILLIFRFSIDTMITVIGRKPSERLPCGKNRENTDRRASMVVNGARRQRPSTEIPEQNHENNHRIKFEAAASRSLHAPSGHRRASGHAQKRRRAALCQPAQYLGNGKLTDY